MFEIIGYILLGAFWLFIAIAVVYLLSRIAMRGWIHEIELFLGSRIGTSLTINKNENEAKEEE